MAKQIRYICENSVQTMKKRFTPLLLLLLLFQTACTARQVSPKETRVEVDTDYGKMIFRLYNETPKHRDNFIKLIQDGFYDDLLFHRVINHFMIQTGDPNSKNAQPGQRLGNGGPGYTIEAEINPAFIHKKGVLAAARQGDLQNPERRSSGSQFYIIQGEIFTEPGLDSLEMQLTNRQMQTISQTIFREHQAELNKLMQEGKRDSIEMRVAELKELAMQKMNETGTSKFTPEQRKAYTTVGGYPSLDGNYTVFGEMIEGFDVLDKIAAVKTDQFNRPQADIKMNVKILK